MTKKQAFDRLEDLMFEQRKITEEMEKIVRELTRYNTEVPKIEMQVPRNDVPEMITLKQASEKTGISYYALRGLCLANKIIHIKSGNKYLVNFGSLVDFLNRGDAND